MGAAFLLVSYERPGLMSLSLTKSLISWSDILERLGLMSLTKRDWVIAWTYIKLIIKVLGWALLVVLTVMMLCLVSCMPEKPAHSNRSSWKAIAGGLVELICYSVMSSVWVACVVSCVLGIVFLGLLLCPWSLLTSMLGAMAALAGIVLVNSVSLACERP